MSADLLRAAAEMRENARATQRDGIPEWYKPEAVGLDRVNRDDHPHIVSWSPAVALAVADWLDETHASLSTYNATTANSRHAFAVARTYLGRQP